MFEKVNPSHPDKIADRIAGALVDLAYAKQKDPRIAVEVLIGHGNCHIIAESSVELPEEEVESIVERIAGKGLDIDLMVVPQDEHLSKNQEKEIRCGDNGIFKGVPLSEEEIDLTNLAKILYKQFPSDGKMVISNDRLIICQSNAKVQDVKDLVARECLVDPVVNPLGDWTGGTNVDTGATNRKLGSDMARSATGGGLHGKDLSKADVSVNIFAWLTAQETGKTIEFSCAIGDEFVNGIPYSVMVESARRYIKRIGGFEKFAEWGLV